MTDTQNPLPTIVDVGSPSQCNLLPTGVEWRAPNILHLHFQIQYRPVLKALHIASHLKLAFPVFLHFVLCSLITVDYSHHLFQSTTLKYHWMKSELALNWPIVWLAISNSIHQVANQNQMLCFCLGKMTVIFPPWLSYYYSWLLYKDTATCIVSHDTLHITLDK